ncbi:helix-turn-helix domain-containing protein [Nonomuraea sp. NPDC050547]|uniref:helix-turn-helix domain-containing protein n=1 Tax=unclassified Nonomuraea TaxID=2593643 RepID=UPI0037AE052E
MVDRISNVVRHRLLAAELRRMRTEAHLSGPLVAKDLGMSPAKFSRLESASVKPSATDIQALLNYYGVPAAKQGGYLTLARQSSEYGWWDNHAKMLPAPFVNYIGLEHEAKVMINWETLVLPGLLQTESYMDVINRVGLEFLRMKPSWVKLRSTVRLTRQSLLTCPNPLQFIAVMDEAVIHRAIATLRNAGGSELVREQLSHLISMARLPNITVRIIRLWEPYSLFARAMVLLRFGAVDAVPGLVHPDVIFEESVAGGSVTDTEDETYQIDQLLDSLIHVSLDPHESLRRLQQLADENGN